MEDVVTEQGPRELLPTKDELWSACRRGFSFDEDDMTYTSPFLKSTAGLVDAYLRYASVQPEPDRLLLIWSVDEPVPTRLSVSGPDAAKFEVAYKEIRGFLLTINLDAEEILPRPYGAAEAYPEGLAAVIGRFAYQYSATFSQFGYPKNPYSPDGMRRMIDAERAYTRLVDALATGQVFLPSSNNPTEGWRL